MNPNTSSCIASLICILISTPLYENICLISPTKITACPSGRRSEAARLMRLWVRIPPGGMDVCCECYVFSGRGLCDELISRPEESYRLWCVVVCDLETSWMRSPWLTGGCCSKNKQTTKIICFYYNFFHSAYAALLIHFYEGVLTIVSPTRKEISDSDQTRNLFNILPTKLNALLSPLL